MNHLRVLACVFAALLICSCDSSDSSNDSGVKQDAQVGSDSQSNQDAESDATGDAGETFANETMLGSDNGIPALRLFANPTGVSEQRFTPASNLRPVQLREVTFLAASAYSGAQLTFHNDESGSPGASLGGRSYSVLPQQIDQWVSIDVRSLGLVFDGPFWIRVTFPASLTSPAQNVIYGSPSTSAVTRYTGGGFTDLIINFDQLFRAVRRNQWHAAAEGGRRRGV